MLCCIALHLCISHINKTERTGGKENLLLEMFSFPSVPVAILSSLSVFVFFLIQP